MKQQRIKVERARLIEALEAKRRQMLDDFDRAAAMLGQRELDYETATLAVLRAAAEAVAEGRYITTYKYETDPDEWFVLHLPSAPLTPKVDTTAIDHDLAILKLGDDPVMLDAGSDYARWLR
jgi:hypothetical protein